MYKISDGRQFSCLWIHIHQNCSIFPKVTPRINGKEQSLVTFIVGLILIRKKARRPKKYIRYIRTTKGQIYGVTVVAIKIKPSASFILDYMGPLR